MEEIVVSLIEAMSNGLSVIILIFFLLVIPLFMSILYLITKLHEDMKKLSNKLNIKNDSTDESDNNTKTDSDKK